MMQKIKDTTWIEQSMMNRKRRKTLEWQWQGVVRDCERWEKRDRLEKERLEEQLRELEESGCSESQFIQGLKWWINYDLKQWVNRNVKSAAYKLKRRLQSNRAKRSSNRYFERKAKRLERMGYKVLRDEHGSPQRDVKDVSDLDAWGKVVWKKTKTMDLITEPECLPNDQPSGASWLDSITHYGTRSYRFWDRMWDWIFDFMGNHEIISVFILIAMCVIPIGLFTGFLIFFLPLIITGNFSIGVMFEAIEMWIFWTFIW